MSEFDPSLYNVAVARVRWPAADSVSAVLTRKRLAFLAVEVNFQGYPVRGLKVQFFEAREDGSAGKDLGECVVTDTDGIARLPRLVAIGHYVCQIENQEAAHITTVPEFREAFRLVLPIGRHVLEVEAGLDLGRVYEEV